MTYYLKYRPQFLNELDQESVRNSLQKIVSSGNIPHALLFSGPKGTGKTSAARILAKVVNCENPSKDGEPCGKCRECTSISKGDNIDVIELDAASHRGIEDIRQIRDAVKLSPVKSKKKVYIIDEAHMLTTEASNALLKTLEEPPSHVMFILATTNPEKLIDTIRSRATNIVFKKAGISELVSSLEKIAKGEGIVVNKDILEVIAGSADGSFRDASKILEQIVTDGGKLTKERVEALLSTQKVFDPLAFLKILSAKDTKGALTVIEESCEKGASAKDINASIIKNLREMLLSAVGLGKDVSQIFQKTELIALINRFSDASAKINYATIEQVPLEIAIIEWCESDGQEGSKEIQEKEKPFKTKDNAQVNSDKQKAQENSTAPAEEPSGDEDAADRDGNGNGDARKANLGSVEITSEVWAQVLTKVRPGHASTEALLRAAKPLEFDGSTLKLGVYYKFHKEHLEGNPHRDILEEALRVHMGIPVRVVCILTDPPESPPKVFSDGNGNTNGRDEVVLTEPTAAQGPGASLTPDGDNDIIKIAEKIFGN